MSRTCRVLTRSTESVLGLLQSMLKTGHTHPDVQVVCSLYMLYVAYMVCTSSEGSSSTHQHCRHTTRAEHVLPTDDIQVRMLCQGFFLHSWILSRCRRSLTTVATIAGTAAAQSMFTRLCRFALHASSLLIRLHSCN